MHPPTTLAAAIRRARLSRLWTQADLARLAGLDPAEVNRLERGVRLTLSTAKLLHLAHLFAERPSARPREGEPKNYEEWVLLLVELDALARTPARAPAA